MEKIYYEDILDRCHYLAQSICNHFKNPIILGILDGCIPFLNQIMHFLQEDYYYDLDFFRLKSYNGFTQKNIEVLYSPKIDLTNREIIIIEDIVDTGKTLKLIHDFVNNRKPSNVWTASLLVKQECIEENVKVDFAGFNVSKDFFAVGFGMDYRNMLRGLPDILNWKNYA